MNTDKVININAGALSYSFPVVKGIQALNPEVIRLWHHGGKQTERQIEGETAVKEKKLPLSRFVVWSAKCTRWKTRWNCVMEFLGAITPQICFSSLWNIQTELKVNLPLWDIIIMVLKLKSGLQAPGCQALVGAAALPLQYLSKWLTH